MSEKKYPGALDAFWNGTSDRKGGTQAIHEEREADSPLGEDHGKETGRGVRDVELPGAPVGNVCEAPHPSRAAPGVTLSDATRRFLIDYDTIPNLAENVYGIEDDVRDLSILLTLNDSKNILIYGPAGVGKTETVKGLVAASRRGAASLDVIKRVFFELNAEALLADDDISKITQNVQDIVRTLERREYVVLVVDNAWNFFECLTNKGAYGAIFTLMEGIAGRKFQSIMIVKDRNRDKLTELHPSFKEIFTPHKIGEQTAEKTLHTLRAKRVFYQKRYGITINDDAVRTIADLSAKYPASYATQLGQPGRAVRLMEFLCASYRNEFMSKPKELVETEGRACDLELEKQSLNGSNPSRIAELDEDLAALRPRLCELQKSWNSRIEDVLAIVTQKHKLVEKLEQVTDELDQEQAKRRTDGLDRQLEKQADGYRAKIADMNKQLKELNIGEPTDHPLDPEKVQELFSAYTGISLASLRQDELERIMNLEPELETRVMGQPHAITAVSSALRKNAAGMSDDNRPLGSFFFLGPTGTGKTELGMALDEFVTGIPGSKPIVFDMTDFQEKHTVSTLLGSPSGYEGADKGGLLINAAREKKRGVLMFDEIEKAHGDLFDILMPVMDKALATARSGEEARFSDFIIIATSNIGAHYFTDPARSFEEARTEAFALLYKKIRPEILGRFNEIIFFQSLTPDAQFAIAKKFLTARNKGLSRQKFEIAISSEQLTAIRDRFYDPAKGGRSLRNVFEGAIANKAANIILNEKCKASRGAYGKGVKVPPGGVIDINLEPDGSFRASFTPRQNGQSTLEYRGG